MSMEAMMEALLEKALDYAIQRLEDYIIERLLEKVLEWLGVDETIIAIVLMVTAYENLSASNNSRWLDGLTKISKYTTEAMNMETEILNEKTEDLEKQYEEFMDQLDHEQLFKNDIKQLNLYELNLIEEEVLDIGIIEMLKLTESHRDFLDVKPKTNLPLPLPLPLPPLRNSNR